MTQYPKRTKEDDFFLPFTTNEISAPLQYTEMMDKENWFQFLPLRATTLALINYYCAMSDGTVYFHIYAVVFADLPEYDSMTYP